MLYCTCDVNVFFYRFFYPLCLIGVALYLVLYVIIDIRQLQSISGIVIFVSVTYITSKYPDRVRDHSLVVSTNFIACVHVLTYKYMYIRTYTE